MRGAFPVVSRRQTGSWSFSSFSYAHYSYSLKRNNFPCKNCSVSLVPCPPAFVAETQSPKFKKKKIQTTKKWLKNTRKKFLYDDQQKVFRLVVVVFREEYAHGTRAPNGFFGPDRSSKNTRTRKETPNHPNGSQWSKLDVLEGEKSSAGETEFFLWRQCGNVMREATENSDWK